MIDEKREIRQSYRIRRYVEEELDIIIPEMRQLVQETGLCQNRRMGKSQFSNLQNVARDTTSPEVILAWIDYQIGRQAVWRENAFGIKLRTALDALRDNADRIRTKIENDFAEEPLTDAEGKHLRRRIFLALIRQYVGQLTRYHVYCQEQR